MTLKMSAEVIVIMFLVSVQICQGKISVTYSFPTDSCVSDPYLVDGSTMVYMKFEGDFGSQECRQMSFTFPKSVFYSYKLCVTELYYSSLKCQSKVWSWVNYDYDNTAYNEEQISGEGCSRNSYDSNTMFSRCLYDYDQISFKLRKSERVVQDNINDTFKFQIETKWKYNYDMIGVLTGGIVGLCIFTGIGICLCINCCRRKRVTGRYCGTCPTCPTYIHSCWKFLKEGLAQGISGELAAAGILLCSCVICRRQNYKQQDQNLYEEVTIETVDTSPDSENKWETVTDFKDQDTAPLCDR